MYLQVPPGKGHRVGGEQQSDCGPGQGDQQRTTSRRIPHLDTIKEESPLKGGSSTNRPRGRPLTADTYRVRVVHDARVATSQATTSSQVGLKAGKPTKLPVLGRS